MNTNEILTVTKKGELFDNICDLLDEYDYEYSASSIYKIIDEWAEQKAPLIEAFKRHPKYLEGKFMIAFDADIERVLDRTESEKFAEYLCVIVAHELRESVPEEIKIQRAAEYCGLLPDKLFQFLEHLPNIAARIITEETAIRINEILPIVHAHAGEKTSRLINRICKYLGYDKHPDYNRNFAKYADSLSPVVIKRHTILSLNPLDYLTMSFGINWASCHTIDKENKRGMPNSYEGQYSSGTMSYMLDGTSIVFYTIDANYNGSEYWSEPKITRQMFHWGEDKLIQGRLYPQDNDYNGTGEYTQYRNIVQKIISEIFDFPNLWTVSKGVSAASKYIKSMGTHYQDYHYYDNCSLSKTKESENENNITVGANPICIECGNRHTVSENINCCAVSGHCCADCGCYVDEEDAIYVDGEYYCEECVSYCSCCGEYYRDEGYWIESEARYVCESCYDRYYGTCDRCDGNVDNDELTWIASEDKYVCENCLERYYFYCEDCGEYYRNSDKHKHGDRILCEDCYKEAIEEENEEAV